MAIFGKKKKDCFKTKCSFKMFEEVYLSNPGSTVDELSERLGIGRRNIYYKMQKFDKKHKDLVDPRLSIMVKEAYKEGHGAGYDLGLENGSVDSYKEGHDAGYESGMTAGSIIGGLVLDMLKGQNMGLSDLIAWISNNLKSSTPAAQPQQQQQPVTEQTQAATAITTQSQDDFYIYG